MGFWDSFNQTASTVGGFQQQNIDNQLRDRNMQLDEAYRRAALKQNQGQFDARLGHDNRALDDTVQEHRFAQGMNSAQFLAGRHDFDANQQAGEAKNAWDKDKFAKEQAMDIAKAQVAHSGALGDAAVGNIYNARVGGNAAGAAEMGRQSGNMANAQEIAKDNLNSKVAGAMAAASAHQAGGGGGSGGGSGGKEGWDPKDKYGFVTNPIEKAELERLDFQSNAATIPSTSPEDIVLHQKEIRERQAAILGKYAHPGGDYPVNPRLAGRAAGGPIGPIPQMRAGQIPPPIAAAQFQGPPAGMNGGSPVGPPPQMAEARPMWSPSREQVDDVRNSFLGIGGPAHPSMPPGQPQMPPGAPQSPVPPPSQDPYAALLSNPPGPPPMEMAQWANKPMAGPSGPPMAPPSTAQGSPPSLPASRPALPPQAQAARPPAPPSDLQPPPGRAPMQPLSPAVMALKGKGSPADDLSSLYAGKHASIGQSQSESRFTDRLNTLTGKTPPGALHDFLESMHDPRVQNAYGIDPSTPDGYLKALTVAKNFAANGGNTVQNPGESLATGQSNIPNQQGLGMDLTQLQDVPKIGMDLTQLKGVPKIGMDLTQLNAPRVQIGKPHILGPHNDRSKMFKENIAFLADDFPDGAHKDFLTSLTDPRVQQAYHIDPSTSAGWDKAMALVKKFRASGGNMTVEPEAPAAAQTQPNNNVSGPSHDLGVSHLPPDQAKAILDRLRSDPRFPNARIVNGKLVEK